MAELVKYGAIDDDDDDPFTSNTQSTNSRSDADPDPDLFDWLNLSVRTSLNSQLQTTDPAIIGAGGGFVETPRSRQTSQKLICRAFLNAIVLAGLMILGAVVGALCWFGTRLNHKEHKLPFRNPSFQFLGSSTAAEIGNGLIRSEKSILTSCPVPFTETTLSVPDCSDYSYIFHDQHRKVISSWHDLSLEATIPTSNQGAASSEAESSDVHYHTMVVEIPKLTRAILQCQTDVQHNPIQHKLAATEGVFPSHYEGYNGLLEYFPGPIYWNYGFLPQTWNSPLRAQWRKAETNPTVVREDLIDSILDIEDTDAYYGDGEPLDVIEIGSAVLPTGRIQEIRILGALALVDRGIADWKVIGIAKSDPMAGEWQDISDLPASITNGIKEWFRWYALPRADQTDGDGDKRTTPVLNSFGNNEDYFNATVAIDTVIDRAHKDYISLLRGEADCTGRLAKKYWFPTATFG